MLPLSSNIVEVSNEVLIAEIFIVGKVPETTLQLDNMGIKYQAIRKNKNYYALA